MVNTFALVVDEMMEEGVDHLKYMSRAVSIFIASLASYHTAAEEMNKG